MHPTAPKRQTSQSSGNSSSTVRNRSLNSGYKTTSSSSTTTAAWPSLTTLSQIRRWLMKHPIMPYVQKYRAPNVVFSSNSSLDMARPRVAGNRSATTPCALNSSLHFCQRSTDLSRFTTQTGGNSAVGDAVAVVVAPQRARLAKPGRARARHKPATAAATPPAQAVRHADQPSARASGATAGELCDPYLAATRSPASLLRLPEWPGVWRSNAM
mmetsp:Transcript_43515/g.138562  ORF Transcript_43515/g.138562 Transcript_43515/m.138562 type:complete len:213 (-) Transcript_43515:314-952(-)